MEAVIQISHLRKSFNASPVLRDISFNLNRNENIVLLGKSGSGKSVLLKAMVGLIDPDYGKLTVLGKEIQSIGENELTQLRRKVGYVFQDGALYDSMTVEENIRFSLERQEKRKKKTEIEWMIRDALKKVGLEEAIDKMPDELSGGMKKRIALARTLVLGPDIILYDEPTAALDPVTSKEIIRLIIEMKENLGISSIIATHDLICARMTADRILILHEGKIEAEGTYGSLENSDIDWVQSFFK